MQSVEFSFDGNSYISGIVQDPETIERILQLHQALIAGKEE